MNWLWSRLLNLGTYKPRERRRMFTFLAIGDDPASGHYEYPYGADTPPEGDE